MTTLENGRVTTHTSPSHHPLLSERFRGVVCDLDGVVYRGQAAIPYAVEALERLRTSGRGVVYATYNASRTPQEVAGQLEGHGLTLTADDVVTTSPAGAARVAQLVPAGAEVLAIGGTGVVQALRAVGLTPLRAGVVAARAAGSSGAESHQAGTRSGRSATQPNGRVAGGEATDQCTAQGTATTNVAGVLQGYGAEVAWADLAEAAYAVQSGAVWVATNIDSTLPTARGMAPGNGTLVDAVRQATGAEPLVVGKPHTPLYDLSARVLGVTAEQTLAIGDRLDTDIAGANAAGMPSLLVLTGVHGLREVALAATAERPRYVAMDLRALHEPYTEAVQERGGWRCGEARVEADGHGTVTLRAAGSPDERLRCVVAAVWSLRDDERFAAPDRAVWEHLVRQVAGEV
jgi:HAD superfamily hydrolase (TIGR01450 family)